MILIVKNRLNHCQSQCLRHCQFRCSVFVSGKEAGMNATSSRMTVQEILDEHIAKKLM
jgi:(2Fe-2S) ferredoxin